MVNPIRFGGMASGLDTESMVKQLVAAERTKVDRFTQQKILKQWQQTAYNDVNKSMANFILDSRKNLGLTRTTSTGTLVSGSINDLNWVKKASSSNTSAFDVTASANAPSGTVTLEIESLASGASLNSKISTGLSETTTAGDLLGFASGTKTVNISGVDIELNFDDNISIVAEKIRTGTGLNANFDLGANRFFMSTKTTGDKSNIKFEDDADTRNLMLKLNLFENDEAINNLALDADGNRIISGTNAKILYNGTNSIEYQSNNISINGLNLTLKAKTEKVETIRIDTDVDGAYNKIKEFVDEYNKMIDSFNNKLSEKSYRDFPPLTDEQKKAMSENDIKLWEEKAKSGLLRNDQTISSMLQTVRADLYKEVEGVGSLYELGITTGSWRDNGKLTIDEFKLKDALRNDSEKVINTLFKSSSIAEETIKSTDDEAERKRKLDAMEQRNKETGVFNRIFDGLTNGIKSIVSKSGPGSETTLLRSVKSNILIDYVTSGSKSSIDEDVSEIDKRINIETERLANLENRYWRQFTAMEKAMSQMNSQSSWLSQQFGGGQ